MAKKLTLKFKNQQFQTDAARAVTDVFRGQRNLPMREFTHDMGRASDGSQDLFPDFVIASPKNFHQTVLLSSDALP